MMAWCWKSGNLHCQQCWMVFSGWNIEQLSWSPNYQGLCLWSQSTWRTGRCMGMSSQHSGDLPLIKRYICLNCKIYFFTCKCICKIFSMYLSKFQSVLIKLSITSPRYKRVTWSLPGMEGKTLTCWVSPSGRTSTLPPARYYLALPRLPERNKSYLSPQISPLLKNSYYIPPPKKIPACWQIYLTFLFHQDFPPVGERSDDQAAAHATPRETDQKVRW